MTLEFLKELRVGRLMSNPSIYKFALIKVYGTVLERQKVGDNKIKSTLAAL